MRANEDITFSITSLIHLTQGGDKPAVAAGRLFEGLRRAQDVDGAHVAYECRRGVRRSRKKLEVVVVGDGAWVIDAERVGGFGTSRMIDAFFFGKTSEKVVSQEETSKPPGHLFLVNSYILSRK